MAVTHADLEIRRPSRKLGGKAGTAVIALCAFCGLLGFVFSVLAESSKTKPFFRWAPPIMLWPTWGY